MQYQENIIEIKNEMIYEYDYGSVGFALNIINSIRDQVDNDMQVIEVGNKDNFKYIFFIILPPISKFAVYILTK